ncbi:MAG: methyltransferase domain-containing protein [Rickettsiales bacterium]|jgi:NADH dehydrogenase [ubiquinone] 1 alpha subcomplex assembly factor 5|nr:methyltransferase domain-containing protein [Rickettsiales bacterium]
MPDIFDQKALIHKRDLVAISGSYKQHFLLEYICQNIFDRFNSFEAEFDNILLIGAMSEELVEFLKRKAKKQFTICDLSKRLLQNYPEHEHITLENETLISNQKFDLIYSFLDLHHINNIPNYLISIKNSLNEQGVFMANFFGEENLKNLRKAFITASGNKITPHIFPYIDLKSAAHLLHKSGFKEPIADLDKIDITYDNLTRLSQDIKAIAETNILDKRSNMLINRNLLKQTEKYLLQDQLEFNIQAQIINITCYV